MLSETETLGKARWLINRANLSFPEQLSLKNFDKFCSLAADSVRHGLTQAQRDALPWLFEWGESLKVIHDNISALVKADPLILYNPVTPKHQAFHDSTAFCRYAMAGNGTGKCLKSLEKVRVPGGWKEIGELLPGDLVATLDGSFTKVLGVYPQGIQKIYRVKLSDGSEVDASGDHLWSVQTRQEREINGGVRVLTTDQLRALKLDGPRGPSVPLHGAVADGPASLPLDPYTLGALIADGYCGGPSVTLAIHGPKRHIIGLVPSEYVTSIQKNHLGLNAGVKRKLEALGLNVKSGKKFIPDCYLFSSISQRMALLRGLCDADGSVDHTGRRCSYSTTSNRLADDFVSLVRSLGGWATKHALPRVYTYKGVSTDKIDYTIQFVLDGAFTEGTPKASRITERRGTRYRRFVSIEPNGEADCTCIRVEHPSAVFITRDYIPTHNSTLAYVENVWCSTGQKHHTNKRGNVVVLSTGHQTYSTKVFRSKLIDGEDGDPLTPMIPEGGKWFHSFDQRGFIIRVACPTCAHIGRPRECTHTRNITCLSAESGVERLMGYTARLGHIDEHIEFEQYKELKQRLRRGGADGRMMITATPLAGQSWEITDLLELWKNNQENNWLDITNPAKGRYVEVFQFSQFEVGFRSQGEIEADRARMSEAEFLVRVMGEPMVISDNPVFNLKLLDDQRKTNVSDPACFQIAIREGAKIGIDTLERPDDIVLYPEYPDKPEKFEGLKVWRQPEREKQYVIGVDSAAGVSSTKRDASAAYVFEVKASVDGSIDLDMVAAWHSYDDVYAYAEKMKLLGIHYNTALVIPEVTGIGIPFMQALVRRLWYPNVWQSENTADQARQDYDTRFGVVTNAQSKPNMVTALQKYINTKRIKIRDASAIRECQAFHQALSQSGLSYRYEGAGGEHDDRVMAMCFVAYAAVNFPTQVLSMNLPPLPPEKDELPDNVVKTSNPKRGGGWSLC